MCPAVKKGWQNYDILEKKTVAASCYAKCFVGCLQWLLLTLGRASSPLDREQMPMESTRHDMWPKDQQSVKGGAQIQICLSELKFYHTHGFSCNDFIAFSFTGIFEESQSFLATLIKHKGTLSFKQKNNSGFTILGEPVFKLSFPLCSLAVWMDCYCNSKSKSNCAEMSRHSGWSSKCS